MNTADFDYHLPPERIAQFPTDRREGARLLVFNRKSGALQHTLFESIGDFFEQGDLLVRNNIKVIKARVFARKKSGGRVEVFFLRGLAHGTWLAMINSRRPVKEDSELVTLKGTVLQVTTRRLDGLVEITIRDGGPVLDFLESEGEMPLPPYIRRSADTRDMERYQTVYAGPPGAVAAPTAGLHFSTGLIEKLKSRGITFADITLHVSQGTFRPVKAEKVGDHVMDFEHYRITAETANAVKKVRDLGNRIAGVGTTTVRALESCLAARGSICASEADTDIFIYPPYEIKTVDCVITNFHLPKSTLFMMISAFCGLENLKDVYAKAIAQKYRFYSYGDSMLIL